VLLDEGVISRTDYYLYEEEWKSKIFVIAIAAGFFVSLAAFYLSGKLLSLRTASGTISGASRRTPPSSATAVAGLDT
jgi:hypothetical protein